ncbi:MAG: ATP synthase F0 subunit B [Terracidiphilus sp.]
MKLSTLTSRFLAQVPGFVLVAVLGCGIVASPARAHAQDVPPAAPASSAPATSRPVNAPGVNAPGKEQQKEENNIVYRHTPIVRSLARTFHMDVEITARLFEYFNFAILALAVLIPLGRFMPRVFRGRSEKLRNDLESARKLTADANTRLSAVEARLAKFDEEIAAIRTHVEAEAKNDEARIKSTIEEERQRIVAAAEQEIASAAANAKRGLRHFAADLAIDQASGKLVLTPEIDRALIAEFVSDASRGGKN